MTEIMKSLSAFNEVDAWQFDGIASDFYVRVGTVDQYIAIECLQRKAYAAVEETVKSPQVILDLGGNTGASAVRFANLYPDALIITIEPDEDNYALLLRNTKSYPNIKQVFGAIWNKSGRGGITNRKRYKTMLCSIQVAEHRNEKFPQGEIRFYTVPELMEIFEVDRIDLLKVDIEGSEKELFDETCDQWLPKVNAAVVGIHEWMRQGAEQSTLQAFERHRFRMVKDIKRLERVITWKSPK